MYDACDVSPRADTLFGPYAIMWQRIAGVATFWVVYAASGRHVLGSRVFTCSGDIYYAVNARERERCPVCGRGIEAKAFEGYCPACGREN